MEKYSLASMNESICKILLFFWSAFSPPLSSLEKRFFLSCNLSAELKGSGAEWSETLELRASERAIRILLLSTETRLENCCSLGLNTTRVRKARRPREVASCAFSERMNETRSAEFCVKRCLRIEVKMNCQRLENSWKMPPRPSQSLKEMVSAFSLL